MRREGGREGTEGKAEWRGERGKETPNIPGDPVTCVQMFLEKVLPSKRRVYVRENKRAEGFICFGVP